jgi:acyl-CoA thioesterase I
VTCFRRVLRARSGGVLGCALLAVGFALSGNASAATNIACVGDSLTFGADLENPDVESYPAVLQTLLPSDYVVRNFGVNATTLLRNGDTPYWDTPTFAESGAFQPNIVLLMLGTNDSKPINWSTHSAEFAGDYAAMIQHYRELGAEVYAVLPPPVYEPGVYEITPAVLNEEIVPLIRQTAMTEGAPVIDVFAALSNHPELFPDTVHPNAAADQLIAQTVFAALPPPAPNDAGTDAGSSGGSAGAGGSSGVVPSSPRRDAPGGCSLAQRAGLVHGREHFGLVCLFLMLGVLRRTLRRA